ncbi:MAG: peptide chain release factor N(5)-glutamine methyltransferase [bacterium]
MKINQALQFGIKELQNSQTPNLDSEILLSWILKKDKSYLFANPDKNLNKPQVNRYKNLIQKRRNKYPIAYLIGKKEFFGLDFFVNRNVLIPRPETEELVEQTLQEINKLYAIYHKPLAILDLGTGSGCIAIAIAKNTKLPIKIYASDICKKALDLAKKNAKYHSIQIKFIQSDLLENIKKSHYAKATRDQEPDIIVANLPYITPKVYSNLEPEITDFEPKKALLSQTRNHFYNLLKEELKKRNWNPILILE